MTNIIDAHQTSVGTITPRNTGSDQPATSRRSSTVLFSRSLSSVMNCHREDVGTFPHTASSDAVVGWRCIRAMSECEEIANSPTGRDHRARFFAVGNDPDPAVRRQFEAAYEHHSYCGGSVRREIGQEHLRQVEIASRRLAQQHPRAEIIVNQQFHIDPKTGQGLPYLHERDRAWAAVLKAPDATVHTFLPGYATGDRYSLIMAMMLEPRLHVSIAYTAGNAAEEKHAREACDVLLEALGRNGTADPARRVTLLEYRGESLKRARESLDDGATRERFIHLQGSPSPLSAPYASAPRNDHVFHISVTTELIARQFRECADKAGLHATVRDKLEALLEPGDRALIDRLVDQVIAEQRIPPGAVGLWVADREFPNSREAEAASRPAMVEQIAAHLKSRGLPIYCIADTFINRTRDHLGTDRLTDRHPYRPELHPHIGRFWAAEWEGARVLAPRQNQWYFMHRLLSSIGGPLVGIRSGALEPLALMGHSVIYLEHKDMFTPERHASWQQNLPYHRLITTRTTGYREKQTEIARNNLIRASLSNMIDRQMQPGPHAPLGNDPRLERIEDDHSQGVLSTDELDLLVQMVTRSTTAEQASRTLWPH